MTKKLKEIESKYRLPNTEKHKVLDTIHKIQPQPLKTTKESDTYYTRADIDFMETQECLRIRTTPLYSELTYKPGTTAEMFAEHRFWKKEVNIKIDGQEGSMKELLLDIGCKELVTVEKERVSYLLEEGVYVSIDNITGLGWFVEVEVQSIDEVAGLKKLKEIEAMLGLKEEFMLLEPYRDLLMKEQGLISKDFKAKGN